MRGEDHVIGRRKSSDATSSEIGELIQNLMSTRLPASRILELLYWSQEPGALEVLRSFLAMPAEHNSRLLSFLASVDPSSVSVRIDDSGRLLMAAERRAPRTGRKQPARSRRLG
jgi:hypothetical protein